MAMWVVKDAPCMVKDKCTKHYLKKFYDQDGFTAYRKRSTRSYIEIKSIWMNNQSTLPYNRDLIIKFQAHINVEVCNWSHFIKYLFKYVNKGSNKVIALIEKKANTPNDHSNT